MTSAIQKKYGYELHKLRKLMRDGPVTQSQAMEHLGKPQSTVSALMCELVAIEHAEILRKLPDTKGRLSVHVYTLTEKYLATLKPRKIEELNTTPPPDQWTWPINQITGSAPVKIEPKQNEPKQDELELVSEQWQEIKPAQATEPTQDVSPKQEPPKAKPSLPDIINEFILPPLAGIGLASLAIWLVNTLSSAKGLVA